MKFIILVLVLLSTDAHADVTGGGSDGGGSLIEGAFRAEAQLLVGLVANSPSANELCSAVKMKLSLANHKIVAATELKDPNTGEYVDARFDAYTAAGIIQLKISSWDKFLAKLEDKVARKKVDLLILHEIYRATGECDDNEFSRSSIAIDYLDLNAKNVKFFKFSHFVSGEFSCKQDYGNKNACSFTFGAQYKQKLLCSKNYEIGTELICFNPWEISWGDFSRKAELGVYSNDSQQSGVFRRLITFVYNANQANNILNLFNFIDENNPFYLGVDTRTGNMYYKVADGPLVPLTPYK